MMENKLQLHQKAGTLQTLQLLFDSRKSYFGPLRTSPLDTTFFTSFVREASALEM